MSGHVPAWKRLGLKLKGPASGEGLASDPSGVSSTNAGAKQLAPANRQAHDSARTNVNEDVNGRGGRDHPAGLKRKQPPFTPTSTSSATSGQTPSKRIRTEAASGASEPTPRRKEKTVSFADDTKPAGEASGDDGLKTSKKKEKKKKKVKTGSATSPETFSLEPALSYLRQWDAAQDSWKFNKNHQTLLIKYVFDDGRIPPADINTFYRYISGLKGFVRTRLRDTAREIKQKDMELGAAAFPQSTAGKEEKQAEYESVISALTRSQKGSSRASANGKRSFDEVEFVLRVATPEVRQRVVKRMRAEMVLHELSDDCGDSQSTTTATTTTTATATTDTPAPAPEAGDQERKKREKPNGGSQQKVKRRRLRNVRTGDVSDDDDGSAESDSGSDSDAGGTSSGGGSSSSSGGSSDEDAPASEENGDDGSSSSSSSSPSASESESRSASDAESEGDSSEDSSEDSDSD